MVKLHIPGRKEHHLDDAPHRASDPHRSSAPPPAAEEPGPGPEVERAAPDSPSDLPRKSWGAVLKGSLREFKDDELTDRAAALTYYGVLALFPALLVLVSLLGITGRSTTDKLL
ncbi:YhjD/YihY/BrkB family envelope integrity protein, partial [Streptomyces sp. NPDC006386]